MTYRSNRAEAEKVVSAVTDLGRFSDALRLGTSVVNTFADFAEQLGAELQARWGRTTFDFLVNNAGTDPTAPFAETTRIDPHAGHREARAGPGCRGDLVTSRPVSPPLAGGR